MARMSQTPLHYACRDGDLELVKDFVEGRGGHVSLEVLILIPCPCAQTLELICLLRLPDRLPLSFTQLIIVVGLLSISRQSGGASMSRNTSWKKVREVKESSSLGVGLEAFAVEASPTQGRTREVLNDRASGMIQETHFPTGLTF